eukprot:COSAG01_NODE_54615_length_331_cov_0.469828_1_plen_70_part_01
MSENLHLVLDPLCADKQKEMAAANTGHEPVVTRVWRHLKDWGFKCECPEKHTATTKKNLDSLKCQKYVNR